MNLVLDIGNTSVKAALFEEGELKHFFGSATEVKEAVAKYKISRCLVSKTGSDHPLEDFLSAQTFRLRYFSTSTKLPFINRYGTPETVGTDRLALVAAAIHQFPGKHVLCIDTGTCITYNFLSGDGEFLGGSIAPGIEMRFKALHHFTARLPLVKWQMMDNKSTQSSANNASVPEQIALIGNTTETSIMSGVLNGAAKEMDGIINAYRNRYQQLNVIITGGSFSFFASALENSIFARPNLVLHGLNAILEYNS